MLSDRFRLRSRLQNLQRQWNRDSIGEDEKFRSQLESLRSDIEKSRDRAAERRKGVPKIPYDPELPIVQKKDEIAERIRNHQVVVICGETGSGKSTQLPKICLELGLGVYGMIGHTQPRRIAARSVAARVAEELRSPLGQSVGYKVRFADETGPNTLIKLMTDGILLAESQNDRFFDQYEVIIIDEAHERSLNIDFLLGMMKRLLVKRRDLKLIITSATIDAKRFAEHFADTSGPAPIIEVSGRTYPIEIRYRPFEDLFEEDEEPDEEEALLKAVDELARLSSGDMLIFMPTERDIFETAKLLRHHKIPGDDSARKTEILPLYARLPVAQQLKVFKSHPHRRIVIATNVAESSLTVPGIRYVIDPGTARISRYSARSKTQRLPIEAISRASADQRAGRCGRIGPGVCIRLFSKEDYESRDRYTTPEIQRTNLASVILQTKALKLGSLESFPFLDPPKYASVQDGYKTLQELGALDSSNELTPLGWTLSKLPVDPRIARIILAAKEEECLREILIIASVLEIQDPRERPHDFREKADAAHRRFLDPQSDFLSFLKIWDFYHGLKESLSRNQLRKACTQNFLSFNRMKEWSDIHLQLLQLVRESKYPLKPRKDEFDAIHRSILTGYLSGIATRDGKFEYNAAGAGTSGSSGGKFVIWPGSGLMKTTREEQDGEIRNSEEKPSRDSKKEFESTKNPAKPKWIVAAERLETTRKYLRVVSRIDSDWIESLAKHLITKTYLEPHWNGETGYVHAYEKVSLFGLVIVPKRRINYGPIEPEKAREIFIQNALVEGDLTTRCDFFQYNGLMLQDTKKLQDKLRRHDLLRGQWAIYNFYQTRIPLEVYDRKSLEKWYKSAPEPQKEALFFQFGDLCVDSVDPGLSELYPDTLTTYEGSEIPIEYRYRPGEIDDGLTIAVPIEGMRQLEPTRLGWLVPGLLEQKIIEMLRALPKEVRRNLVPIPDTARKLVRDMDFAQGVLEESLAVAVSRLIGRNIRAEDFQREKIPDVLKMNIRVLDSEGKTLANGRELEELRKELGIQASESIAAVEDSRWNRENLTQWDFGDLPESVEISRGKLTIKAFPMIVDRGNCVDLRLSDSLDRANRETRLGLMRLFMLKNHRQIKTQVDWIPQIEKLKIYAQPLFSRTNDPSGDFLQSVGGLLALRCLELDDQPIPRTHPEFSERMRRGKDRFGLAVQELTRFIGPLFESFQDARLTIEKNKVQKWEHAFKDAKNSLAELTEPGFLVKIPWNWLREYPRYFRSVAARFEKLKSGGERADRIATEELAHFRNLYRERLELHEAAGITDPELLLFRFMIEEYRVSLFAQKLGTALKISSNRLDKQWENVRK